MTDTADSGTIAEPKLTPEEVFKLAVVCAKAKFPMLITGPPGVGKTSVLAQVANYLQCKIHFSHPVVDSPLDYKGHPYGWMEEVACGDESIEPGVVTEFVPSKKVPKATFIPYGDLEQLITATGLFIYVGDDLGQATNVVQAAWMQMMLGRRINGHRISDDVVFFACSNRKEDQAGVTRFLEPLKDRFHAIVEMKTDAEQWIKWAIKADLAHEVITWVRMNPQWLDDFKPASDFSRSCTPRAIHQMSDLYSNGIDKSMQLRVFASTIGTQAAVNFKAHLEYYTKMQDPDAVLLKPEKAEVPDDPALLYTLCGALAAKANKKTIEPILKYAKRLDKADHGEFSMLLVKDSVMRNPKEVMQNLEFCRWAQEHQEDLGI